MSTVLHPCGQVHSKVNPIQRRSQIRGRIPVGLRVKITHAIESRRLAPWYAPAVIHNPDNPPRHTPISLTFEYRKEGHSSPTGLFAEFDHKFVRWGALHEATEAHIDKYQLTHFRLSRLRWQKVIQISSLSLPYSPRLNCQNMPQCKSMVCTLRNSLEHYIRDKVGAYRALNTTGGLRFRRVFST
jgi:hypothetical protein